MATRSPLAAYMRKQGLTVAELARQLETDYGAVWRLVNTERTPTLPVARRIERLTAGAVSVADWPSRNNKNAA